MIANVAGVPVEELPPLVLASGAGAALLLARAWVASHVPFRPRAKRPVSGPGMSGPGRVERRSQAERRFNGNARGHAGGRAWIPGSSNS
jgi:hypothetical protein